MPRNGDAVDRKTIKRYNQKCVRRGENAGEYAKKKHERSARGDTGAGLCAEHKLCRDCRLYGLRIAKFLIFDP